MSSPPPLPSSTSDTDSSAPPPLPSESQSEPSTPSWQRTVVISSISSEVEDEHLKELFECCGPIRSVTKATILGERAVEIEYEQEAHAKGAVTLSGTPLGDRPLKVEPKTDPSIVVQQPLLHTPMQNVMMLQGMQGMMNMMFPTPVGVGVAAVAAAQSRLDEIARTVYVGNVNLNCDEQTLAKFFSAAGNVTHVKFANEIPGTGSRFSFIEFDSVEAVPKAMALSGSILIDRPVKVGKANNPIFKPATTPTPAPTVTEEVLQRIREAQQKLANNAAVVAAGQAAALTMVAAQGPPQITLAVEKKEKEDGEKKEKDDKEKDKESSKKKKKHRSRSRSGSRSKSSKKRKHRSRSRSRGRRHRSRSRSRDPRDHRRFRDERSRSPGRNYSSRSERAAMKPQPKEDPHKGLFFNGYRWQKIEEVIQTTASSGIPPNLIATLGTNLPGLAPTAQLHAQAVVQTLKATQPVPVPVPPPTK